MKTVLCHGVFDVLHVGHLDHLEQAKALGDRLVVSVTADRWVTKGPGRPVHNQEERKRMLEALSIVDDVVVTDTASAVPAIERVKPAFYVKGEDYRDRPPGGKLDEERAAVEKVGGQIAFTTGKPKSSSTIANALFNPLPAETQEFINSLKSRGWTAASLRRAMENLKDTSVCALGEPIIDEYVRVRPEGKSPKEQYVTWVKEDAVRYEGGTLAVAAHLREWCDRVTVETGGMKPIVKRRFVNGFLKKVFSMAEDPDSPPIMSWERLGEAELVVCCDYGHGLVPGKAVAARVSEAVRFLALSVQSNSLNWGFNLAFKWPRADYLVLDEDELRLAHADRRTPLEELAKRTAETMGARTLAVTLGHRGCLVFQDGRFVRMPALASRVVDRMGAGDAFLAVTAPLAFAGAEPEVLAFVGNVAGAIKVGIEGHAEPVRKRVLLRWVESLLA